MQKHDNINKLKKQTIYSHFQYIIPLFLKIPRVQQTADIINIEVKDLKTSVSGRKKNRLPYLPEITRIPQQNEMKKSKLYDYFL